MGGRGLSFRGKADLGHGFWNSSGVSGAAIRRDCGEKESLLRGAAAPAGMVEFEKSAMRLRTSRLEHVKKLILEISR